MIRRLLLGYLTLTVFVLLILEIPLGITLTRHEHRILTAEVERDAFVLAASSEDVLEGTGTTNLGALVANYAARTGAHAIIVGRDGLALADSEDPSAGRDFSTRPEIAAALRGEVASGVRRSDTLRQQLLYVAVPVSSGGTVHGAARITFPMTEVQARITRGWWTLAAVALVVVGAATAVGWYLAATIARPLRALESMAGRLAAGDLGARATADGPVEVRSLARTVNEMAGRIEELVGAQRAFVADASHHLRTPLTALRLHLETIEEDATPSLAEEAAAAAREAWRLERIVDGLLALARAEGTRRPRVPIDVAAVIEERRAAWAPLAVERGIDLRAAVTGPLHTVAPDGALEQILDNLIANALQAAPAGTAIVVGARAERGDDIEVHVVDGGQGMDPTMRARAFDRFWRGADTGGGSGLGLALVRHLARECGGDAGLDAAAGGGIDAWVRLPRTD